MDFFYHKKNIFIGIGVALIVIVYILIKNNTEVYNYEVIESEILNTEEVLNETVQKNIFVHITGAVMNNGIIQIEDGSRIADAIEKAGGITEEANISKVNLAYQLEDGQKIYIPSIHDGEIEEYIYDNAGEGVLENEERGGKININKATQTELETLSGVGASTALKIIKYREEHGKFKNVEDIKNVSGIGDAKFEGFKEEIDV